MTMANYIYILLLCALLVSCQPTSNGNHNSDHASAQSRISTQNNVPSVEIVNPSIRSFSSEQVITGTVKADKMVMLHAMENGVVSSMNVDIGDKVHKGQLIAQLSNPMLNFELKAAKVKVMQARAKQKGAEAQLNLSKADADVKSSIYNKIKSVYEQSNGLTTIIELENAKREAEISNAKSQMALAEIDRYKAELDAAQYMMDAITERQSMLSITAPFSGVVSGRYADPGAMIQNALNDNDAKPLVSMESDDPVRISIPIPESDMTGISIGDPVSIEFPTMPDEALTAKVSRVSRSLDPASKTMEVQLDLKNPNSKYKAGMYVKARIQRSSSTEILSLPHAAIMMRKDAPFIMLVKNGVIEEVALKKGLSSADYFEILNSDIGSDAQVIVKGKSMVKAGQKVNAIKK